MFFHRCVLAHKPVFSKLNKPPHIGLIRPVNRPQFRKPRWKVLLQPHKKQRPHAKINDMIRGPSLPDRQINLPQVGFLHPNLIAQITSIAEPVHLTRRARHGQIYKPECRAWNIRIHQLLQHRPRIWPRNRKPHHRHAKQLDLHQAIARQMLLKPPHMVNLRRRCPPN